MGEAVDSAMLPGPGRRNLDDFSKTASMSMVDINNLIVSLRGPVKKNRVRLIHQLTKKIKILRSKKGKEDQVKKNNAKADRLQQEITTLNGLDVDKVSKFALSNTTKFEELMLNKPDAPMTSRAMTRLACTKDLDERVQKFRKEHDDWKELANFILYKNTGRRYRKNKSKRKEGESVIRDMVVKNLKENKSDHIGNDDEIENKSDNSDEILQTDDASTSVHYGKLGQNETENKFDVKSLKNVANDGNDSEDSDVDEESNSDSSDNESPIKSKAESGYVESGDSDVDSDISESVSNPVEKESTEAKPAHISSEIVVRKFTMDESEDTNSNSELPSVKHKPKSSFFLNDDSEGGESSESGGEEHDEVEKGQSQSNEEISEEQTSRGRAMVESVFVSNLSQKSYNQQVPNRRFNGPPKRNNGGWNAREQNSVVRGKREPIKAFGIGEPAKAKSETDEKSLHPSWEASRKRKEALSIQAFSGKKIKFDD